MGKLMVIGAGLFVLGLGGAATACLQSETFSGASQERPVGQTDTQQAQNTQDDDEAGPGTMVLLSGISFAAGLILMGIGIGNWKRPVPSGVRPANPWSDQPGDHGDSPKGLV